MLYKSPFKSSLSVSVGFVCNQKANYSPNDQRWRKCFRVVRMRRFVHSFLLVDSVSGHFDKYHQDIWQLLLNAFDMLVYGDHAVRVTGIFLNLIF